ncbi:MAG: hypothetical protein SFY69_11685 [Planctomycetota bacterium]|nr:hypothetical protein [Planctomycetota bacterium]
MKTCATSILSASLLLACAGTQASAQCATTQKLQRVAAEPFDVFGFSVAIGPGPSSTRLVIGTPNQEGPAGVDTGAFSVWGSNGGAWTSLGGAFNGTGQPGDWMGYSVDQADPYIIAGAPGASNFRGKALIYVRSGNSNWVLEDTVTSNLLTDGNRFGESSAISTYGGGWAVVGAPYHSFHGVSNAGAAFFYTRTAAGDWVNAYTIWGGDFGGDTNENRGSSVAMSKTSRWAAVGGPNATYSDNPAQSGVVYVVQRLDNGLVGAPEIIEPPIPQLDADFGRSVAIEGNVLVVGAPAQDITANENFPAGARTDAGRVFVFEHNGTSWVHTASLRLSPAVSSTFLGHRVTTDGNQILAYAAGTSEVYVFEKLEGTWTQTSKLTDPDVESGLGGPVGIYNGFAVVGDPSDSEGNIASRGAVYSTRLMPGQPADTCGGATELPTSEFTVCTRFATPSSPANVSTCGTGGNGQGNDIWYSFSPTCSGNAIIDTFGSDFDTVLSVHPSCPGLLLPTTIVCNDDASFPAPNNRASLVTFNFTAGETYYVRVTGYNGASGTATIRPSFYYQHPNDTCGTALPVGFGQFDFNTCSASDSNITTSCNGGLFRRDIWFNFVAPQSGLVRFDTCSNTAFDTMLSAYDGAPDPCPTNLTPMLACSDDACGVQSALEIDCVAGQSYRIRLGGYTPNSFGPGTLTIAPVPTCDPDVNCDGNVDQDDVGCLTQAVAGEASCLCGDPDFNQDGNVDQDDISALTQVVGGSPCP